MGLVKAAVCHEFDAALVVENVELRAPERGEIEVTLGACAICHSDISFAAGAWGGNLPAVYGHEAAGRISALGDGVRGLNIGDVVVVTLIRSCGECLPCHTGNPATCATPYDGDNGPLRTASGGMLHQAMACGAFAEKVVVDHRQVVKLPENIPMEAAAMLACGVITGGGAVVNSAAMRAGQNAVIIGAGGVGLNAIQGARIAGAANIIAVDMQPDKLEVALEFGATHAILATGSLPPWKQVRKITDGRMADAVFVTVGAIPAYDTAPRYLARNGRMIMVGMPHSGEKASYEPVMMAAVSQGMIGTKMGDVVIARDIPWMVDLYQQGRLKLDELISGRWSLEQINEAIADTKAGTARRNVILFDKV